MNHRPKISKEQMIANMNKQQFKDAIAKMDIFLIARFLKVN